MADVIVRKSKIDGLGVFASRDFKKGEIVIPWDVSHQLTTVEVKNLPKEKKRYIANLDGKNILMQSPANYVNHSCDANTHADNFCDIAKRDIKKGEEITSNYSKTEISGFEMICHCGSKNCRGVIKRNG